MTRWGAAPLAALSLSLLVAAPVYAEGTDNYPASDVSQLTGAPFPLPLPAAKPVAQVPLPDPNPAPAAVPAPAQPAAPQAFSPVGNSAENQAKAKALAESVRTPPWLRQTKQAATAAVGTQAGPRFSPWRIGIMLAIVGGLAGVALYAKRRRQSAAVPGQKLRPPVKVITSTRVGPKAMAVVTEVNGRRLLLGVTDHSVNALAWLDQAEMLAETKDAELPDLDRDFLPEAPELDRYASPFAASALDEDGAVDSEPVPARDSERMREAARRELAARRDTPARGQPLRTPARETKSSPSGSFLRVLKSAVGRGQASETLESPAIPNAPLDRMADEMRDEVKLSRRAVEREQADVEGQAAGLLARAKRSNKSS